MIDTSYDTYVLASGLAAMLDDKTAFKKISRTLGFRIANMDQENTQLTAIVPYLQLSENLRTKLGNKYKKLGFEVDYIDNENRIEIVLTRTGAMD